MIDLIPDADQQAVADSIAGFLADRLPVERLDVEGRVAHAHEFALWRELAGLGCFGLAVPEAHGGVGLGLAEDALAFREYGRHLLSPSMLATVLAAQLVHGPDVWADGRATGERLVSGELRAALALPLPPMEGEPADRYEVFDARPGDLLLAWTPAGLALHEQPSVMEAVPCTDDALTLHLASLDASRALHAAREPGGGELALTGLVLTSAMLVGIAEAVRDMAVNHAKTRMQFGQLIGGFQAIKHRCADMALRAEAAWSQAVYAALSVRESTADREFQALTAKLTATRAALDGAADNIQTHGGMGFTAEIQAHLYLKRTHVLNQAGGNLRALQARLLHLPRP